MHVSGSRGPITGRSRTQWLTVSASTGADGVALVDGHRWDSHEAAAIVRERAGDDAGLTSYQGPERFDGLNLLVATDGAVASMVGLDSEGAA